MSQYQCGGPSSQNPYASLPRWAVTPPTSIMRRMPIHRRNRFLLSRGDASPGSYAVLDRISPDYPPAVGRLHTCYSPVRRSPAGDASISPAAPRLACVKPVASVHPEPGSNSPLFSILFLSFLIPKGSPKTANLSLSAVCPSASASSRAAPDGFLAGLRLLCLVEIDRETFSCLLYYFVSIVSLSMFSFVLRAVPESVCKVTASF